MRNFADIDWSQVILPPGTSRSDIEHNYQEALKDIVKLDKEFKRYFSNKKKKAVHGMMTDDIFREVWNHVRYLPNNEIDVSHIARLVLRDDRELFKDVTKFVGQLYVGKPQTFLLLHRFKVMYLYYLICAGF